jgi:proline dehydrogenase
MESQQLQPGLSGGVRRAPRGAGSAWLDLARRRRASAYIAGPGLDDALAASRRLAADGVPVALGYVSVKLSAVHFDPALLGELEAAAQQSERRLHIDALGPDTVDRTWELVEGVADPGALGIALPGRFHRSVEDARRALDLGLVVRVVKGQWADPDDPNLDSAVGFLKVVDAVAGSKNLVAVATHDIPLMEESVRRLTAARTPCEVELLLGLPFAAPARTARRLGVPVRLYVPYGETGAAYGVGELVRNPATAWWLVQDLLLGKDKTWQSIRRSRARL